MGEPTLYPGEKGIHLRLLEVSDIDDRYLSWFADTEHLKYFSGSGKSFDRTSIMSRFQADSASGTCFTYGIFDTASELCVGTIRIGTIDTVNKTSDMTAMIGDSQFLGRGISVAALRVAIRIAFEQYDIRKLHGGMFALNVGSIKAYLRAGWVVEGCRPGHYYRDGKNIDRILVACYNPAYFDLDAIHARIQREFRPNHDWI